MNRAHLDLDQAIDRVAKRLTHVDEDAQFTARVIAALPERSSWFGWLTQSWAPRLAMMAIVAGSLLFWNARHATEVTPSAQPLASVVNSNWPQLVAAIAHEPLAPGRTMPVEREEPVALLEPHPDHERALSPVDSPANVEIASISPGALPAE